MRTKLANILLITGLGVLFCGAMYFGWRVHNLTKQRQELKQDYSFFNSVTFGLFSVDAWREQISDVINAQVNGYSITPEQKEQIQQAVEKELHLLVAKTVAEFDKPQKSIGGKLKKMAFNVLVDSGDLQKQVKPFAILIVKKVSSPASQARLKGIASDKIKQLEDQTYDNTYEADEKVKGYIFKKYHVNEAAAFEKTVNERLGAVNNMTIKNTLGMLVCVLSALAMWWFMRKRVQLQTALFTMSLLFAGVLLAVGLTSPVIEVDARIQSLNFVLLGGNVSFTNQVLFFQSKSIWGIITTLLSQQKPDAIAVGILILLFIVLLPFIRLMAKGLHMFVKNSRVINYLAFESGKLDMADVLIVGMLMTYIGLNSILKSQLTNLNIHNGSLVTKTVNFSSLQPGYFIFVAYVAFEVLLSYILRKIAPEFVKPRRKYKRRQKAGT